MREDQQQFLNLRQLPARLNVQHVAWLLNCPEHDVPVLVAGRLLKPLGNPPPSAVKYFATVEILESMKDRAWLSKVTVAVTTHWRNQNARKRGRSVEATQNGPLPAANVALN